jgi:hypothetical protein
VVEQQCGRAAALRRRRLVMNIETARSFLLWCTIINYGVLALWALLFMAAHDPFLRLWGKLLPGTTDQFDMLNLAGITFYKSIVIVFNLVPCIVLYIIN